MVATSLDAPSFPVAAGARRSFGRIAGVAGLAFVGLVAAENMIVGSASPPAIDASAAEIADHVAAHKGAISVAVGMVPLAVIALFAFIAAATERLRRGSAAAAAWTRFGMSGLLVVAPLFLTGMLFEYVLLANADDLAARGAVAETLWQLRGASLILTGVALAVGLVGLSRAARIGGLIPAWHEGLGFVAAAGFVVGSVAAVPAVEGSPVGLVGFAAFVLWLIWLALTSIRLIREPAPAA